MTTNKELLETRINNTPQGVGTQTTVFADRARNAELWDVEGNRYIDLAAGIAVVNTGHNHPDVIAAVRSQLDRFSHTCFQVAPYDVYVQLAERLNAAAPGPSPKKTIFLTTGAEAVENAVKIARRHTGRSGVIAFSGAFHGRTMMGMALTGKVVPYKVGFGPFPAEVFHVPFPIEYHGVSVEDSLAALEALFQVDIAPRDVAAIIVEPVQGEGGFYPAPDTLMHALRALCDEHGIVLIVDEIQTGFARTGRFFCSEYADVEPDLMTVAKGVAGGFPLAAVVGKAEIMDAPLPGGLGGTYAGSPIGCAAALAVIDVIAEENLVERAVEIGALFRERLEAIQARYPEVVGDIRAQRGAMIAMELVQGGAASRPDPELTKRLVAAAYQSGLVLLSCGSRGNVIRFLPALTIEHELIAEGLVIVENCLARILQNR